MATFFKFQYQHQYTKPYQSSHEIISSLPGKEKGNTFKIWKQNEGFAAWFHREIIEVFHSLVSSESVALP